MKNPNLPLILLLPLSLIAVTTNAQRTSASCDIPIYANGTKPDLTPDPKRFESQMEIVDRLFEAGDCELQEGTVGGTGYRRLLRFDIAAIDARSFDEGQNRYPNVIETRIHIPDPRNKVRVDASRLDFSH